MADKVTAQQVAEIWRVSPPLGLTAGAIQPVPTPTNDPDAWEWSMTGDNGEYITVFVRGQRAPTQSQLVSDMPAEPPPPAPPV